MIKYFCDMCGDEIGNYNINEIFEVTVKSPAAIRSWGDDVKTGSYMFCCDCVRDLTKFIEQGGKGMKTRISIAIPEEIYQLIHEYAAERECTHKEIILEALTEYLDQTYHSPDLEEEE